MAEHGRFFLLKSFRASMPGWKINSSYEEFLELARTLRGVAFQPK
jgi:hypothetical protein